MAKINDLTELTTVADADVLAIVDDPAGTPVTKKITRNNLVTSAPLSTSLNANAGITMGSRTAGAATTVTDHLALWGTTYGIGITASTMNFVTNGVNVLSATSTLIASKVIHDFQANVRITGHTLLGENDLTPGILYIYGGANTESSGSIRIYNPQDQDTTVEAWQFVAFGGDFCIQEVPGPDVRFRILDTGGIRLSETDGDVQIGVNDSVPGVLSIYGGGTGESSGALDLYNNADDDTNANYWRLTGEDGTGDFIIGDPGLPAALRIDETDFRTTIANGISVTGAGVNFFGSNVNFQGDSIAVGLNDSVRGTISVFGNTTAGGGLVLYNGADDDTSFENWLVQSGGGGSFSIHRNGIDVPLIIDTSTARTTVSNGITINNYDLTVSSGNGIFNGGSVHVGQNDTTPGFLPVYGGGATESGGLVRIYNAADQDSAPGLDYYDIYCAASNNSFMIRKAGASNPDFRMNSNGVIYLGETSGTVRIGVDDTTPSTLELYGGPTYGGIIKIYQGANEDANNEFFNIACDGGNFLIRAADNSIAIRVNDDLSVDMINGPLRLVGYTVANLPNTAVALTGQMARVTDANAPSIGSTVTGGGSAQAQVWYNGSNWTVTGI